MKYSRYNSILAVNSNCHILYNALSDKFVILKESAYRDLVEYEANELKNKNGILYEQMITANSIVDDTYDEWKAVLDTIIQTDNDDSEYYLHINPTMDCNFKCWYCYENHIKSSKMPDSVIDSVKRLMANIVDTQLNLRKFNLSFFGGEPLLFFASVARPLIEYINNLCSPKGIEVDIHFTSNGFLLKKDIVNFLKDKNVCFQITLDGGKDNHDKTRFTHGGHGSYDTIVKNIKLLAKVGIKVILRINYTSKNIYNVSTILDDIDSISLKEKNLISIDFQKVWQDDEAENNDKVIDCLSNNIKMFHSKGFRVSSHKILDSVHNSCYGDKRFHAVINFNGDVFNCTARDFNHRNRTGYLNSDGTIIWERDSLEKRMTLKFSKPVCHTCRIAPLCGGGCRQRVLESSNGNGCIYFYSERDIDQIIYNRFEFMFISQI